MLEAGLLTLLMTVISHLLLIGLECPVNLFLLLVLNTGICFGALLLHNLLDQYFPRGKWVLWYGYVLLLWMLFYKVLWRGLQTIANCLFQELNDYYGMALRSFPLSQESGSNTVLFMAGIGCLLLPLYMWNDKKKYSWWFLVELAVISIVIVLLVGNAPSIYDMTLLLLGLLFYRMNLILSENENINLYGKTVMAVAAIVIMGLSLIMAVIGGGPIKEHHNYLLAFQKRLENRIGLPGFAGGTDGHLTNQKPRKTHKSMLTVTLNQPVEGKLFFRGFVGEEYVGDDWTDINTAEFYQAMNGDKQSQKKISQEILETAFYAVQDRTSLGERICNIYYTGVKDNYSYSPYYACYRLESNELEEHGDGSFTRSNEGKSTLLIMNPVTVYNAGWESRPNAAYETYVKEHYLQVPANLKVKLIEFMGSGSGNSLSESATLVKNRLQQQCSYSQDLDRLSFQEDYVEHFLFEEKKGFCCHFATAATLMFRSLGIPARYVTGYCAYPEEFTRNEDNLYQADITDDAAHAWTEIYEPTLGWIPIEVTPGYEDSSGVEQALLDEKSDALEDDSGEEEYAVTDTEMENTKSTSTTEVQENSTEAPANATYHTGNGMQQGNTDGSSEEKEVASKSGTKLLAVIYYCLKIAGCVMLIILLVFACLYGKRSYEVYQYRRRHQKDYDKAIRAIRVQLLHRLRKLGFRKEETETERDYLLRAASQYFQKQQKGNERRGDERTEVMEQEKADRLKLAETFYATLEKAAYSGQSLDKSDIVSANQFYDSFFKNMV